MIVKCNSNTIGCDVHVCLEMGVTEADRMLERPRSVLWVNARPSAVSECKWSSDSEVRVHHILSVSSGVWATTDRASADMPVRSSLRWRHGPIR